MHSRCAAASQVHMKCSSHVFSKVAHTRVVDVRKWFRAQLEDSFHASDGLDAAPAAVASLFNTNAIQFLFGRAMRLTNV